MTMLQHSGSCIFPCTLLSKKSAANNGFVALATAIGNECFWLDCPVTMAWLDLHYEISPIISIVLWSCIVLLYPMPPGIYYYN
jgi:hypothetical protein